ncbi:hypothetical protein THAOC_09662 [Thalassiosira oceanica]|uniref:Protein kinase domain-containing protein n=1 Tax=Thalassiosira oceanica TaxID=159749 RepID=K0SS28_THAOC|nr:hypothetical protein THAOC_09662 [Thalassiosira oceanica]|eukprot:EJK69118.1 hypothetical protein THAOC_09662 [Thalassiosira oceanica]
MPLVASTAPAPHARRGKFRLGPTESILSCLMNRSNSNKSIEAPPSPGSSVSSLEMDDETAGTSSNQSQANTSCANGVGVACAVPLSSSIVSMPALDDNRLDDVLAMEAGESADSYLNHCFETEVSVLNKGKFDKVPQFQKHDFIVTKFVGKGSFSDVFEVVVEVEDNPNFTTGANPSTVIRKRGSRAARRASFAKASAPSFGLSSKQRKTLAMKCLRPQVRSNSHQFIIGAEDLVHETAMLASLEHPNIIKIHGRASGKLSHTFVLNDGFFVLLDRLTDTLADRIQGWAHRSRHQIARGATAEQLAVAKSIADAVSYLHSKRIVFRDLKPDNVGFDSSGTVKLFDFGFALGMPSKTEGNPSGLILEKAGTPRFMAPEVGLVYEDGNEGYGPKADVYSFAIVLWQLCSKEKPFKRILSKKEFKDRVFKAGVRPFVEPTWPRSIKDLLKTCWHGNPDMRPEMLVSDCLATSVQDFEPQAGITKKSRVRMTRRLSLSASLPPIISSPNPDE